MSVEAVEDRGGESFVAEGVGPFGDSPSQDSSNPLDATTPPRGGGVGETPDTAYTRSPHRRLAVASLEEVSRAGLESFLAEHLEGKGVGKAVGGVEGETDGERVLDLRARDTGGKHRADVVRA
jgi:hypothetical protein